MAVRTMSVVLVVAGFAIAIAVGVSCSSQRGPRMDLADRPAAPPAVKCQIRPVKDKFPFNERPRFEVALTNVSAEPIDLIATAEVPGGLQGPHYPCATLRVIKPGGAYFQQSEDSANANPRAVRIEPGKSWSFTYPSTPDEQTFGQGPLPSLSALLPGVYTAEFCYAVREDVEKKRLAGNLVYADSAGDLAGKRPGNLWTGVVYAEPIKYEGVGDDSPQLAILRDVYGGKGLDNLRLELRQLQDDARPDAQALRLRLHNTGDRPIYHNSHFGLVTRDPAGRMHPDFGGPRSGIVMQIAPKSHMDICGWSFDLAARKPGLYTVWAEYQSMGGDGKVLAKSNEIRLQVPPATPPATPGSVPSRFGEELDREAYFRRITGTETPQDREKRAAREKQAFEDAIRKMAPDTSTVPATHQPAAQPAESIGFGPVVERVVRVPSAKNDTFLDLETGKLLAYEDSNGPDEPTMSKELSQIYRRARWARASGADLCLPPDGRFDKEVTGLTGLDMRMLPTEVPFDRLTPQGVAEALADRDFNMWNEMRRLVGKLPATFLVETREGHVAVVQVAALADPPPGLKVRYRIAAAPLTVPDAPLWITLAPSEESVKSLKDLRVVAEVRNLDQEAGRSGEWEIRTADNTRRIAWLPYDWHIYPDELLPDGKRIVGGTNRKGLFRLDESQLRRVGQLEKGDYLLAWHVGGKRCSNVMRFRIDADHHPNALPLLELAEVETGPGRRLPVLVIRARRHAENDPAPRNSDVAFATLNVDGQDRTLSGMGWAGRDEPMRVGEHYTYLLDLRWWTWDPQLKQPAAPIDLDKPHVIFAKVGRDRVQQTPPIRLTYARPLGEAWDLATPKLAPVPSPEASISLSGAVVDLQGQPGRNYEVTLVSGDGAVFRETADGAGKYRFLRIPPGTYKLGCNPPFMGQPELAISGIVIQAGKTMQKDVSLEGKFFLAGRVTDADGKPIPKMAVDLSCEDRQAGAEFMDTTQTDEQGRYRLASPLGTVTYIGVNGKRINGNMPRLSAGENPVDFPADKGHFRAKV